MNVFKRLNYETVTNYMYCTLLYAFMRFYEVLKLEYFKPIDVHHIILTCIMFQFHRNTPHGLLFLSCHSCYQCRIWTPSFPMRPRGDCPESISSAAWTLRAQLGSTGSHGIYTETPENSLKQKHRTVASLSFSKVSVLYYFPHCFVVIFCKGRACKLCYLMKSGPCWKQVY